MSHFTLLVLGEDIEKQLEPFNEQGRPEYMKFEDKEEEWRKEFESETTKLVRLEDGTYVFPWNERFRVPGTFGTGGNTHKVPDNLKEEDVPLNQFYKDFDSFCEAWHGIKKNEEGRYGYLDNPNAKWDWYQIGGRWAGKFILKPGAQGNLGEMSLLSNREVPPANRVSQARKGDIDWEAMKRHYRKDAEKIWEEAQSKDEKMRQFIYDISPETTREQYVERHTRFSTFAVLHNGEWKEKGEMLWFGIVKDEKDHEDWQWQIYQLIDSLPDDTLLTICDCHI